MNFAERVSPLMKPRKILPVAIVIVVLSVAVLGLINLETTPRVSFAFEVNYQPPTSYAPGVVPPNVYLAINFTGPGYGSYSYTITFNDTSGTSVAANGTVVVSHLSPFTAYTYIPVPADGVTVAHARIFRTGGNQGALVFAKTLIL